MTRALVATAIVAWAVWWVLRGQGNNQTRPVFMSDFKQRAIWRRNAEVQRATR